MGSPWFPEEENGSHSWRHDSCKKFSIDFMGLTVSRIFSIRYSFILENGNNRIIFWRTMRGVPLMILVAIASSTGSSGGTIQNSILGKECKHEDQP